MKRKPARIKRQLWLWIDEYCMATRTLTEPNSRQHARMKHCEVMINALMDELEGKP